MGNEVLIKVVTGDKDGDTNGNQEYYFDGENNEKYMDISLITLTHVLLVAI